MWFISYGDCATIGNYVLRWGSVYGVPTSEWKMVSSRKYLAIPHKKSHLLCTHHTICIIYSTVGRSIADISDRGANNRGKYATKVRYIQAMDQPTVLYVIYRMVIVQLMNLSAWDCWTFSKRRHFSLGGVFHLYMTLSQYIISYACAITIRYII